MSTKEKLNNKMSDTSTKAKLNNKMSDTTKKMATRSNSNTPKADKKKPNKNKGKKDSKVSKQPSVNAESTSEPPNAVSLL